MINLKSVDKLDIILKLKGIEVEICKHISNQIKMTVQINQSETERIKQFKSIFVDSKQREVPDECTQVDIVYDGLGQIIHTFVFSGPWEIKGLKYWCFHQLFVYSLDSKVYYWRPYMNKGSRIKFPHKIGISTEIVHILVNLQGKDPHTDQNREELYVFTRNKGDLSQHLSIYHIKDILQNNNKSKKSKNSAILIVQNIQNPLLNTRLGLQITLEDENTPFPMPINGFLLLDEKYLIFILNNIIFALNIYTSKIISNSDLPLLDPHATLYPPRILKYLDKAFIAYGYPPKYSELNIKIRREKNPKVNFPVIPGGNERYRKYIYISRLLMDEEVETGEQNKCKSEYFKQISLGMNYLSTGITPINLYFILKFQSPNTSNTPNNPNISVCNGIRDIIESETKKVMEGEENNVFIHSLYHHQVDLGDKLGSIQITLGYYYLTRQIPKIYQFYFHLKRLMREIQPLHDESYIPGVFLHTLKCFRGLEDGLRGSTKDNLIIYNDTENIYMKNIIGSVLNTSWSSKYKEIPYFIRILGDLEDGLDLMLYYDMRQYGKVAEYIIRFIPKERVGEAFRSFLGLLKERGELEAIHAVFKIIFDNGFQVKYFA